MARQSLDVTVTDPAGNQEVSTLPLTFRTAADRPNPPYHFMLRTVGPHSLPDGTITGDELDADVAQWIEAGYTLLRVDPIATNKGAGGEFLGNVLGYHFVLK